jgi:hypothetical protein
MEFKINVRRLLESDDLGGRACDLRAGFVGLVERIDAILQQLPRQPGTLARFLQCEIGARAKTHDALAAAQFVPQNPRPIAVLRYAEIKVAAAL